MARRTIATIRRPIPHAYVDDRGCCGRCGLLQANSVHAADAVAAQARRVADAAELDRRRYGDSDSEAEPLWSPGDTHAWDD